MSSKIISVTFKNFFNFYDSVEFDFEGGLNIVSAPNGGGKTNFLSGIRWIATGELYFGGSINASKRVVPGTPCKELTYALNMKAKNKAKVGDIVTGSVALAYSDGSRRKYEIVKSFSAEKPDDDINSDKWIFTVNQPRVTQLGTADLRPLNPERAQGKINSFIGSQFHAYTLLKGEEIDRTIDFANEASVRQMIESLTNITFYKVFLTKLENTREKLGTKYLQTAKATGKNEIRTRSIGESIVEFDSKIKNEEFDLERNREEYSNVTNALVKIENDLGLAENREKIRREIDAVERRQLALVTSHSAIDLTVNEQLFGEKRESFGVGCDTVLDTFRKKYDDYKYKKRQLTENENTADTLVSKLPFESPDTASLLKMLDEGKCFVCGRSAEEDSEAHQHIQDLIAHFKEERDQQLRAQNEDSLDLSSFFSATDNKVRSCFSINDRTPVTKHLKTYLEKESKHSGMTFYS